MKKRIVRIYLPYLPVLILFVVLYALTGKGANYHYPIGDIIRNILLIKNPSRSIHPFAWTLVFQIFYYGSR